MAPPDEALIELDDRKRAPLGRLAEHDRYLATRDSHGRIVLEPALVMTETERRLLENEGFWARVAASLDQPTTPLDLG